MSNLNERDWEPADEHGIEEGGWQKPVAPPKADSPPVGLPRASSSPTASSNTTSREKSSYG